MYECCSLWRLIYILANTLMHKKGILVPCKLMDLWAKLCISYNVSWKWCSARLHAIKNFGFKHVLFEGDSSNVTKTIKEDFSRVDWAIKGIVADIKVLQENFEFLGFWILFLHLENVMWDLIAWSTRVWGPLRFLEYSIR